MLRWQRCGLLSSALQCSTRVAHAGGNIRLVAGMAEGLPIIYNSVVQEVEYSDIKVRVSTASTSFEGESAALWKLGNPELSFVTSTECLGLITSTALNVLNHHAGHLIETALICLPLTLGVMTPPGPALDACNPGTPPRAAALLNDPSAC